MVSDSQDGAWAGVKKRIESSAAQEMVGKAKKGKDSKWSQITLATLVRARRGKNEGG